MNVLLADDHRIVRNGIHFLLDNAKDVNVCGEASNGQEVLDFISEHQDVDIILTDIIMPVIDGFSLLAELRERNVKAKVIILSMHDDPQYIARAFQEGACGYLLKNISLAELVFSLQHVHGGGKYLCSDLSFMMLDKWPSLNRKSLADEKPEIVLTAREDEILRLIAGGLTATEIADKIFVSKRTVEGHKQSLIDKTASKNTAMLIRYAMSNGLIE